MGLEVSYVFHETVAKRSRLVCDSAVQCASGLGVDPRRSAGLEQEIASRRSKVDPDFGGSAAPEGVCVGLGRQRSGASRSSSPAIPANVNSA